MSGFRRAWFAPGAHMQTVWGRLTRARRMVELECEEIETPDGDVLVLDHLRGEGIRYVLMHGLEGSAHSVYIQGILSLIAKRGFAATAINFRSCARDPKRLRAMLPNRRPRFYHSGETTDFDFVVRLLCGAGRAEGRLHTEATMPLVACGASLGGNALLKWLGENAGQTIIRAAATISVPYDLGAGGTYLERGLGPYYVGGFLRTLKKKVKDVAQKFPETRLDIERAMRAKSFREFDDVATAPLHGFTDANDYYARSSSIHYVGRITTPTLCISAEDDPFLPPEVLARVKAAASPSIEFVTTRHGGHVGFVGGTLPWKPVYWAEELVVDWLADNIKS